MSFWDFLDNLGMSTSSPAMDATDPYGATFQARTYAQPASDLTATDPRLDPYGSQFDAGLYKHNYEYTPPAASDPGDTWGRYQDYLNSGEVSQSAPPSYDQWAAAGMPAGNADYNPATPAEPTHVTSPGKQYDSNSADALNYGEYQIHGGIDPPLSGATPSASVGTPTGLTAGLTSAPDRVDNAEVRSNNFAGMRMPGVPVGGGPASNPAGWQHFATPQAGVQAISHQLDRYASGATTGRPLDTIRKIVSTWAPASDNNPTNALIARASQILGVSPDTPINVSDPATKAKLIEATIRNEQGGKLPVDPAIIQQVAYNQPAVATGSASPAVPAPASVAQATPPAQAAPATANARSAVDLYPGQTPTQAAPATQAPVVPGAPVGAPSPAAAGVVGNPLLQTLQQMNDPSTQAGFKQLLANQGMFGLDRRATLARMAAGFLSGHGPADSLAKGFAGLAEGRAAGSADLMKLLQMSQAASGQQIKNFSALINSGINPSSAMAMTGLQVPGANAPGGIGGAMGGAQGGAFLQTLDPTVAAQVKAIAEGRMQFPGGFALKSPYWQNMLRMVSQYDPSFDAVNYNSRAATYKDFTSGPTSKNVTSLNTAIGHAGTLYQAADALSNSSMPMFNGLMNTLRSNTGDPRIVAFNTAKQAFADELTRVFRGTGGSVSDVEGWEKNLNASNSPEQLHAAIQQGVNLLNSRLSALGTQLQRGMGTTATPIQLLNPHALQTLRMLPGGADMITENGGTISAVSPGQAAPAAFSAPAAAAPAAAAPAASQYKEGDTATAKDGRRAVFHNGQWVIQP